MNTIKNNEKRCLNYAKPTDIFSSKKWTKIQQANG